MNRDDFVTRMAWLVPAALVLAALLRLVLGAQWFSIHGWASVALLTLPVVWRLLTLRLRWIGASPRRALLYVVPVGLLAGGTILFWVLFFSGDADRAVMLGSVRSMVTTKAPFVLPALHAVVAALALWIVASAARRSDADR